MHRTQSLIKFPQSVEIFLFSVNLHMSTFENLSLALLLTQPELMYPKS